MRRLTSSALASAIFLLGSSIANANEFNFDYYGKTSTIPPDIDLSSFVEKDLNTGFSRDNGYALGTVAPELTRYSGVEMKYPAKANRMLIFPAWVEHHVKPNLSDQDRISISFNIL